MKKTKQPSFARNLHRVYRRNGKNGHGWLKAKFEVHTDFNEFTLSWRNTIETTFIYGQWNPYYFEDVENLPG